MDITRRRLLAGVASTAGAGLAGCTGGGSTDGSETAATTVASSFFVFGDITAHVAGGSADASLLVPLGQHGHGWEPGPSVRQDIRNVDLFVHGMHGFQPWVDNITADLAADDASVTAVDVSAGVGLLETGSAGHEGHEAEDTHDGHDNDTMDPHFWMDPIRTKAAVSNVQQGLADVDPENAEAYADNAERYRSDLDDLHRQIESVVTEGSNDVILLAGHDALQYFSERYGVQVEALTNVSPDDRPTLQDIERAQAIIDSHDLQYICVDPLESRQAAQQLVEETSAEAVLPLTAMPGLTEEWDGEDWGYIEVMETVNIPTLERVLDA